MALNPAGMMPTDTTMNQKILSALFCGAKTSGMRLKFRQIDSGDYEARWTFGARSVAWCGTLAEVWVVAGGAR